MNAAPRGGRSVTVATHGMVAASHPLAAQIGLDVLQSGGNAVDAALATNAALGLMEPTMCGIGGDLYAIVWEAKTQRLYGLNASGRFTLKDFADHTSTWVEPVSATYRGYEVWEIPPPGQGIATLQMLNILEGFDLGRLEAGSAEYWHLFLEAKKLAFADRARYYADPEFDKVPVAELISKPYAAARRKVIDRH